MADGGVVSSGESNFTRCGRADAYPQKWPQVCLTTSQVFSFQLFLEACVGIDIFCIFVKRHLITHLKIILSSFLLLICHPSSTFLPNLKN